MPPTPLDYLWKPWIPELSSEIGFTTFFSRPRSPSILFPRRNSLRIKSSPTLSTDPLLPIRYPSPSGLDSSASRVALSTLYFLTNSVSIADAPKVGFSGSNPDWGCLLPLPFGPTLIPCPYAGFLSFASFCNLFLLDSWASSSTSGRNPIGLTGVSPKGLPKLFGSVAYCWPLEALESFNRSDSFNFISLSLEGLAAMI